MPDPSPVRAQLWSRVLMLGAILGGLGLLLLAVWTVGRIYPGGFGVLSGKLMHGSVPASESLLTASAAQRSTRLVDLAYADASRTLARDLAEEHPGGFRDTEIVHFASRVQSPCAAAAGAGGPFYCARDRTAAFDMKFTEALGRSLRNDLDAGTALMAGQLAAVHVQNEMGLLAPLERDAQTRGPRATDDLALALHADCLVGVWVAREANGLGPIAPELYGRVLDLERALAGALAITPRSLTLGYDLFGAGSIDARIEAFRGGTEAGRASVCDLRQAG